MLSGRGTPFTEKGWEGKGTGGANLRGWGREEESQCGLTFSVSITHLGEEFRKEPAVQRTNQCWTPRLGTMDI